MQPTALPLGRAERGAHPRQAERWCFSPAKCNGAVLDEGICSPAEVEHRWAERPFTQLGGGNCSLQSCVGLVTDRAQFESCHSALLLSARCSWELTAEGIPPLG